MSADRIRKALVGVLVAIVSPPAPWPAIGAIAGHVSKWMTAATSESSGSTMTLPVGGSIFPT